MEVSSSRLETPQEVAVLHRYPCRLYLQILRMVWQYFIRRFCKELVEECYIWKSGNWTNLDFPKSCSPLQVFLDDTFGILWYPLALFEILQGTCGRVLLMERSPGYRLETFPRVAVLYRYPWDYVWLVYRSESCKEPVKECYLWISLSWADWDFPKSYSPLQLSLAVYFVGFSRNLSRSYVQISLGICLALHLRDPSINLLKSALGSCQVADLRVPKEA